MGTENCITIAVVILTFPFTVKLNNPQMGTENSRNFSKFWFWLFSSVKLNNPQMGTEKPNVVLKI